LTFWVALRISLRFEELAILRFGASLGFLSKETVIPCKNGFIYSVAIGMIVVCA